MAGAAPGGPFEGQLQEATARLAVARGDARAIVSVLAIAALDEDLPPGPVAAALRSVAEGADGDPLVAAHAAHRLSLIEDRRDAAGGEARRRRLGLLSRFSVLGPFAADGRAGHGQVFPPESEVELPDAAQRYPGKEREISWRRATTADGGGIGSVQGGAMHLDALLRPDTEAVAFALTYVHSDRPRDAAVRLGSPGPVKVWCNGALVHARDVVRPAAFDQDAAPVRLRKGWNRLLIKTLITQGSWRIFVRLTDRDGRPLPGLEHAEAPPAGAQTSAGAAVGGREARRRPGVAVRELGRILEGATKTAVDAEAQAQAWLDYGLYLAAVQPGDQPAWEAEIALQRAASRRATALGLLALGAAARDDDGRRHALERVLGIGGAGAAPLRALALARLGDVARAGQREALAVERWRAALREDPACWPAALWLADTENAAGLPAVALARLEALPDTVRAVPRVIRHRAMLLETLGRQTEAEGVLQALVAAWGADVDLTENLASAARARGDVPATLAHLRRVADMRPDFPSMTLDLARALEGAGRGTEARAAMEQAVARLPDEPRLRAELGKLLHRAGYPREALEHLRAGLTLRPQNPELRRYADRLAVEVSAGAPEGATGGGDPAWDRAADVPALLAAEADRARAGGGAAAPVADEAAAGAVVLIDRKVVRVHANRLSETFAQRVVVIRTDRGARENRELYIRYAPGSQDVEIREARIFRRADSGELLTLEASARDHRDLSEPWYGLYYDSRAEVIRYEGLRPGDVIELQYTVADIHSRNQMGDYFGDMQLIAEGIPKRHWDYTLVAPAGTELHFNSPRLAGLTRAIRDEPGRRVHRFTALDVPPIEPEPAMPGYAEVAPYLHVSTDRTWAAVGARYWRLVEEQLTGDDRVREAARAAVRGRVTEEEKVRALHSFVLGNTRYVGLELGIHGYKPYKVGQVLARRFGDCKDKASLLVALLREVGVAADLVLVRTRRGGRIDDDPASLAVFDHAITYVPKLGLYLDGTAEFSGMSELPSQDQGVMVLRVSAAGAVLTQTPVLASAANRAARRWEADVEPDGAATIREDMTITGQAAPEWRQHYQTEGERHERYDKVWSARHPGARLASVAMPDIEDRDRPVRVRAEVQVPHLGWRGGEDHMELPIAARDADFARAYARLSTRRTELVIAYPWQHDEELVYALPAGWRAARLPSERSLETSFGTFRLQVTAVGAREVRVISRLDVRSHRVAPTDYAAFRRFLGDVDAALGERIVLRKDGGASRSER